MTVEAYPVYLVPHSQSGWECGSHHPTMRKMRRSLPGQLEILLEAQWGIDSLIAVGSMNRGDQTWDCEGSRTKAERFAAAVNTAWSTDVPTVQVYIDVDKNLLLFGDAATGCEPLPAS